MHRQLWSKREINFLRIMVILLGVTAMFMLLQFFLILAPEGTCNQIPHWELLWTLKPAAWKVNHCMSTAAEINKTAWYYVEPVFLQAWGHILLTILSLYFLWRGWRVWQEKLPLVKKQKTGQTPK